MKILLLINGLMAGGKERQFVELVKQLKHHEGIEYRLGLMNEHIHYKEVLNLQTDIHYFTRRIKKDPTIFFKLFKVSKLFRPDIIHTWDTLTTIYAIPVAKLLNIKLLNFSIQNAPNYLNQFNKTWLLRLTFPFSDRIVANSNAGLQAYSPPTKRSTYIYNGFDFARLNELNSKNAVRKKFNIRTKYIVGMVASFTQNKDYNTFLSVAKRVVKERNDVCFVTIGDGPSFKKYRELYKENENPRIRFLGKQQNVESIVNIFDITVLTTFTEGISNSIMEYMALGKPVIATIGGGTKEIVEHNKTGFLIEPKQIDNFYSYLSVLLNDPVKAKKMGKEGQKKIRRSFSLELMVKQFAELYKQMTI